MKIAAGVYLGCLLIVVERFPVVGVVFVVLVGVEVVKAGVAQHVGALCPGRAARQEGEDFAASHHRPRRRPGTGPTHVT